MKRGTFALGGCIVFALLLAARAMADEDYCIDNLVSPNDPFVLKAFKIPKAGECTTVIGHHVFAVLSGVACSASNGSHVTFGFTRYNEHSRATYHIDLQLPSQFGGGDELQLPAGPIFFGFGAFGGACTSPEPVR